MLQLSNVLLYPGICWIYFPSFLNVTQCTSHVDMPNVVAERIIDVFRIFKPKWNRLQKDTNREPEQ